MTETNTQGPKPFPGYKDTVKTATTTNITPEKRQEIGKNHPTILPKYGFSIQPKPSKDR